MKTDTSDKTRRAAIENRMGYVWVTLPERITVHNYMDIEADIVKHLAGNGDRVVFDLSRTHDMYSSAIGILVRIRKRVCECGGIVCIVNISGNIRELLKSLHLDKIFPMYTTDVEFEISQDEVWHQKLSEQAIDFLFIGQVENGLCRISIAGEMELGHAMNACRTFTPGPGVKTYILDLTGLTALDSEGAGVFMNLLDRIARAGGTCRAYGANPIVKQILQFLGAEQYVNFLNDEKEALSVL